MQLNRGKSCRCILEQRIHIKFHHYAVLMMTGLGEGFAIPLLMFVFCQPEVKPLPVQDSLQKVLLMPQLASNRVAFIVVIHSVVQR